MVDKTEPQPDRLHALDAVRGGALLLGVAFHASLSFLPGPQIWVVRDAADPVLGGFFIVSHMLRMTLFFLIAGFFGRMLIERRGSGGFVRDRAKRVVAPLFVFWPLIIAGSITAFVLGATAMNGGVSPTGAPPPPTLATFPLTHLWFLYLLTLLYLAALAVRGLARMVDRREWIATRIMDPALSMAVGYGAASVLLAVPGFLALASMPEWMPAVGIPTPDMGFIPNKAALAAYATAFFAGWLLNRQQALLTQLARGWLLHLVGAMLLSGWIIWSRSGDAFFAPEADPVTRVLLAGAYMIASWAWTLGLIGAALRFLDTEQPWIRYLADSSYWIYLVHLPVVMLLQVAIFPLALPALIKFAIVVTGASFILLASYHLLVRRSFLGRWLNRRTYPRTDAKPAMEAQTL